jgi:uncharacterized membrane protein YbaN (DUF454 family)
MIIKHFFRLIASIIMFCLALIGFLLPFVPGTLFLLIAFILFSPKQGKAFYKKIKAEIRSLRKKDSS